MAFLLKAETVFSPWLLKMTCVYYEVFLTTATKIILKYFLTISLEERCRRIILIISYIFTECP